jgi:ATP-binding cassette subfamily B protein
MPRTTSNAPIGSLRTLWPLVRKHLGLFLGWLLALACASAATLGMPMTFRVMIDQGFAAGGSDIDHVFVLVLAVTLALAVASAAHYFFISLLGERIVADLRERLYAHLIGMDADFYDRNRSSELVSRLIADSELLRVVIGFTLSTAVRGTITVLGSFVMLFVTSPRLASYALLGIPLTVLPIILGGNRLAAIARANQDRVADANSLAAETLGAVRTIQAHSQEPYERGRFVTALQIAIAAARQRIRTQAIMIGLGISLVFGGFTAVLWLGAHDVAAHRITAGTLGQFLFYAVIGGSSIGSLAEVWSELRRAAGGMGRISELLAESPTIVAPAHPALLPTPLRGELRIEQVSFRYPQQPDHAALADFSLRIRPGETVAVVGPSGAGKSTLFSLLLRFHDPEAGRITIDGLDIRTLDPAALRTVIGLVPQQPTLFAASARTNILYGRLGASEAQLDAAVRAAHAADFIAALPQQLDTQLGERGTRLSGGQQQRIAIARALLKNAPILLLDEATSALDAHSERAVQQALETLMHGRTTLVIAHRLATVLKADRIIVMDHGRITAEGTHESLMADGGLYAELARLQFLDRPKPAATSAAPVDA